MVVFPLTSFAMEVLGVLVLGEGTKSPLHWENGHTQAGVFALEPRRPGAGSFWFRPAPERAVSSVIQSLRGL